MKTLKRILRVAVAFSLSLLIVGCSFTQLAGKLDSIRTGITTKEVISSMGTPESICETEEGNYLNYDLYATTGDAIKGYPTPYFVKIKNGIVEEYGKSDINWDQIKGKQTLKEWAEIFKQSNIKRFEIRFIDIKRFETRLHSYDRDNQAIQSGHQLFKEELFPFIEENLQKKGYHLKLGEPINITIPLGSSIRERWGSTYGYYFTVHSFLESLQTHNFDAILLFTIPAIFECDRSGYYILELSYYIFDLTSKKLIFTNHIRETQLCPFTILKVQDSLGKWKTVNLGVFERAVQDLFTTLPDAK